MSELLRQFGWAVLWRPDALLAVTLLGASYFALAGKRAARVGHLAPLTRRQASAGVTILAALYAATGSPLSLLAEHYLFTAYVLQMLLLTQVVPPLLFLALPRSLFAQVAATPLLRRPLRLVASPVIAPVVYGALASVSLLPGVLQPALNNDLLHFGWQAALLASAVLLWRPLMDNVSRTRLGPGAQLIYLLFAMNFMMPVIVFLLFSATPWYPLYAHWSRSLGVTPLLDQQAGALLMAAGMLLVYGVRAVPAFYHHSDTAWYE